MNLNYYYWIFEKDLKENYCDKIIQEAEKIKKQKAGVGYKNKSNKNIRKSNLVWLNKPWIFETLFPYIEKANMNSGWNFQIDCYEKIQYTSYDKGHYYNWHCDSWPTPYGPEEGSLSGKIRKLSAIVLLSDEKDFKGGELEFDYRNKDKENKEKVKNFKGKGTVIVFPSFLWHKVHKLTKGNRKTLVFWVCGDPYK